MGLIKLLIVAAVVYFIWRFYQSLRAAPRRVRREGPPPPARMVKCSQCEVHVPEPDAVFHGNLGFCCQEHRRLYIDRHEP